jgi:hypothetical protein
LRHKEKIAMSEQEKKIGRQVGSGQSARAIKAAGGNVPVVDPQNVQTVYVDLMTGAGERSGVVGLTLATLVISPLANGKSEPEAVICARLRFNFATATDIRNALDKIIKGAM